MPEMVSSDTKNVHKGNENTQEGQTSENRKSQKRDKDRADVPKTEIHALDQFINTKMWYVAYLSIVTFQPEHPEWPLLQCRQLFVRPLRGSFHVDSCIYFLLG